MPEVRLPGSEVPTSAIGVGCAYLTEGFTPDEDRRIIDAAFEAGARHFDVAPSYGMGTAEAVLGRALAGRRGRVTITTKVGIPRHEASRGKILLRALLAPARQLRRRFQFTKPRSRSRQLDFSPGYVEATLSDSVRMLRTDYLDAFLLHEVSPALVTDELVELLTRRKSAGQVRAIGLATSEENATAILAAWPRIFDVVQYSWSVFDPPLAPELPFRIIHRAIMHGLSPLRALVNSDPTVARLIGDATGHDVMDPRVLPALLVGAAISENRGGIVLVASRNATRTRANVEAALDPEIVAAGRALRDVIRTQAYHTRTFQH